eukprot:11186153-Lingulodinium_polyedra.AAC.1
MDASPLIRYDKKWWLATHQDRHVAACALTPKQLRRAFVAAQGRLAAVAGKANGPISRALRVAERLG